MGLHQTKKLLHRERNNLTAEKATYGMGKRTDAETEAPILWPPDAKN